MTQHRCGGTLVPQQVKIRKKIGFAYQTFTVDGFRCDYCGDEVISRDIAIQIDEAVKTLREQWKKWRIKSETRATPLSGQSSTGTTINVRQYEDSSTAPR